MFAERSTLVLLAALGVLVHLTAEGPVQRRRHPGLIVAGDKGQNAEAPLRDARAFAYAQQDPDASGPCPPHSELLDRDESDASGAFAFEVDEGRRSYYAYYCANGFQSRGEWSRNDADAPAQPEPVRLWPNEANGPPAAPAALRAIKRVFDYAATTLRQVHTETYEIALGGADPNDAQVLRLLARRPSGGPTLRLGPPPTTAPDVLRILDNAAGHLQYYWRVAPVPFTNALEQMPVEESIAVNWLRERPRRPVLRVAN